MSRATLFAVAVGLGSLALAVSMAPKDLPPPKFEDTGTELFSEFQDPTTAASLEVISWNESAAQVKRFKVELKEGKWTIPSHHGYSADGTERMGKAAASFIGVKRDIFRGDNPDNHAAYGVLDPEDATGKDGERGQRVIIKDASGGSLVDVIVGKGVDGKEGFQYVRLPGDNAKRVYGSKLSLDISTDFADWIEKDLLRIEQQDIDTIVYDPYQVDEVQRRVVGSAPMRMERQTVESSPSGRATWVLAKGGKAPAGQELDGSKVRQMLSGIDRLEIVGVRPRPRQLTVPTLLSKGFFVADGRLFGNEGQVTVAAKDGVVHTLYFGEVNFDSGLELTAGGAKEPDGSPKAAGVAASNRYLFVNVGYSPDFDVESKGDKPEADAAAPKGKTRAEELQQRFGAWFFVISDTSFKQIHQDSEKLFKEIKKQ